MKLLKTIPLLLSLAVATAQAADVNPHPQSFGTWHDADGGNFVINKNGFKEFAHVSAECGQKSKGYVHESSWISGKELAKSIRESIEIEDSDNKAYGSEMNAVLKTIRPNKNTCASTWHSVAATAWNPSSSSTKTTPCAAPPRPTNFSVAPNG